MLSTWIIAEHGKLLQAMCPLYVQLSCMSCHYISCTFLPFSFVAAKLTKVDGTSLSCFIYFCPEETPVRSKMTMSSSKASVLAAAGEHNVTFDKYCYQYYLLAIYSMFIA